MSLINNQILKEKNSLLIFASQLVSVICDKMMSIGLVWYLTLHFSINIVPWFLAVCFLPHIFMAFFSTKIINRFGELKTVLWSELFRGIVLLFLFFLIYIFQLEGEWLLGGLFISGFLMGVGASLFNPAILSLPPKVVPLDKVAGLNALIDSSFSLSTILGAAFAVLLLTVVDLKTLILINALSFFWAFILQSGVKTFDANKVETSCQVKLHLGPIDVLLSHNEVARMLVSFLCLNLFLTPVLVIIPWYVQKIYLGDGRSLAIIEGAMGVGAFLTALFLSFINIQYKNKNKRILMIGIVSFLFGCSFLILGYTRFTWQGASLLFLIGALSTYLNVIVLTYFQTALKEDEVPAIMTAVNVISAASVPISLVFSGLVFRHFYIPSFAKFCGLSLIVLAIFIPKFLKGSRWKTE